MAQRWPAPNVKPKLSQETFDEAVKTNIEDFDMSPDEAVKSAADEFVLQGYDMSCVVKTSAGGDLSKHAVCLATQAIAEAAADPAGLLAALAALQALLDAAASAGPQEVQEASAIAFKASTLATVMAAVKAQDAATEQPNTAVIQAGLVAARTLMAPSVDIRDSFEGLGGPALIMALHTQHIQDMDLQAEIARCAECAAYRQEQNKDKLMQAGYGVSLLQLLASHTASVQPAQPDLPAHDQSVAAAEGLQQPEGSVHEPFVAAACGVLRAVTTADDDRPPCSKAFATARLLARQHQALSVLLAVLRLLEAPSAAPTVAAVLSTVRQLSANEEICKDFSDDGGVTTCLKLISSLCCESKDVVRCGLGALRQLTNSDHTKRLLSERGAAELLMRVTASHPEDVEVLEPALGVMANMTLRQPEVVALCAEIGVIDWVLDLMRQLPSNSLIQRQASILIRNMVVRTNEYRAPFLDKGAEGLLRAAKKAHPRNCTDVGSAALRDLGLDNYNEGWTVGGENMDMFLK